jgi:uncharacterized membrane protein YphA (DoxX/SURF4 family)
MYEKLRQNDFCLWLIINIRFLLGFAFLPSGMKKLLGHRFTSISVDNPVGLFFENMYQTGFYWNFLGLAQVLFGVLLMTQRFASFAALFFITILTNIWLITISLEFKGTWIITSLMMFANIVLLIWDYQKYRSLFMYKNPVTPKLYKEPHQDWIIVGVLLCFLYFVTNLLSEFKVSFEDLFLKIALVLALIIFIVSNIRAWKRNKNK